MEIWQYKTFQIHDFVKHPTFGNGRIKNIEPFWNKDSPDILGATDHVKNKLVFVTPKKFPKIFTNGKWGIDKRVILTIDFEDGTLREVEESEITKGGN
jgi:hypothetical protein